MSRFPHLSVPFARSLSEASIDAAIRPGLRQAFPLPDDTDAHFQRLLDVLTERAKDGFNAPTALGRPMLPSDEG